MHARKRLLAPLAQTIFGDGKDANASELGRNAHATIDKQARQGMISNVWQLSAAPESVRVQDMHCLSHPDATLAMEVDLRSHVSCRRLPHFAWTRLRALLGMRLLLYRAFWRHYGPGVDATNCCENVFIYADIRSAV